MLKPIKENKVFAGMFGETKIEGQTHGQGGSPELGEYAKRNPFAKATLNITEQVMLLKTKPELAEKLRAMAQV
jgi:hypothetical protein